MHINVPRSKFTPSSFFSNVYHINHFALVVSNSSVVVKENRIKGSFMALTKSNSRISLERIKAPYFVSLSILTIRSLQLTLATHEKIQDKRCVLRMSSLRGRWALTFCVHHTYFLWQKKNNRPSSVWTCTLIVNNITLSTICWNLQQPTRKETYDKYMVKTAKSG